MLVKKKFRKYNDIGRLIMMKKHNTVKVVLITMVVLMLLTWILPAAYFQSSYVSQGRVQMGLFDLFTYPVTAISYFGFIALFVLVIGGFYGVLYRTGAYRSLLDTLVKKFKGKEKIALAVIMVLFAILTSVCGLNLGILIFFPFIISLVLLMGYDKVVAALTTVGSVMVGLAGCTFATGSVSILTQVLAVDVTSEMVTKIVILVIGLVLLIFNTIRYGENHKLKSTKKNSEMQSGYIPEAVKGKKKKIWPLIVILDLILLIMILGFISWNDAFKLTIFEDVNTAVMEFKLFGFPIFAKILGTVPAFGSWTVNELMLVLVIASALIALIYKVKFDDYMQGFIKGAKEVLKPAVLIILIYTCLVIVTYHPFQLVIYKALFDLTKGFNVATAGIAAILASAFNVESAYTFQSVVPYLASVVTDKTMYPVIAVMFQSLYGAVMLVAPTSIILMGTISYLGVSYKEWLKNIWKFLLEFIVILFIIFTILVLI